MPTQTTAKAFKVTEQNREFLQSFIQEPITDNIKYILASSEGYLLFDQEPSHLDQHGHLRVSKTLIVTYYDIEYDG